MYAHIGRVAIFQAAHSLAKGHTVLRHHALQLVEDGLFDTGVAVSADESQVVQQWAPDEFLLCQQMKCPSLVLGKQSHGGEFSRKGRPIETIAGLDLQESHLAVEHVDQEVGDDVGASAVFAVPGTKTIMVLQQFNPKIVSIVLPLIPDGHRLLPHVSHSRARNQDGCCCRFELSLAADRTSLFGAWHQEKRARGTAAQAKGRRVGRLMRIGHGKSLSSQRSEPSCLRQLFACGRS